MIWFKFIKSMIRVLSSNVSPKQISGAVVLGLFIGLNPYFTLHSLVFLVLIYFLQVHVATAFLSIAIWKIIGYLVDPLSHTIGYWLLVKIDSLNPFWTNLYNTSIIPFTKFYNTVVLGSFVISLILTIPVFIFCQKFIVFYRANVRNKVENLKIVKLFKLSNIYKIYSRFKG